MSPVENRYGSGPAFTMIASEPEVSSQLTVHGDSDRPFCRGELDPCT